MCAISAISNNKIKEIIKLHQKKYREETGLFIAEGTKAVEELISENLEIIDIFSTKNIILDHSYTVIDEATMKKISTTSSPCEILAVAKKKSIDKKSFEKHSKVVLLDKISDPGNLGTIIRSAAAFNVDGIILFDDCVDLYSPKVIRSTTGNFFKVPIIKINSIKELKQIFNNHKFIATALSKDNNISLKECSKIDKYVIMFGAEAKGLNNELINIADKNIHLRMENNVESLNLSICASIILYELYSK